MSESAPAGDHPVFSIVIPTFNAEAHIERLLKSIRRQSHKSYSVTLVDHGSDDRTTEIAQINGCKLIDLPRPSFYSPPGRSRNVGARATPGAVFLHLDADMELTDQHFLVTLEGMLDDDHRAAIIHEQDVASGFLAECKALERSFYIDTAMEGARAVRRDLFDAVGGYNEQVSSGEDLFVTQAYRRQTSVLTSDALHLRHHIGSYSIAALVGKKFSYGRTARSYLHQAPRIGAASARAIVGTSLAAYLRNWRVAFKHPLRYLCIFPLRVLEFGALQSGMWFGREDHASPAKRSEPSIP